VVATTITICKHEGSLDDFPFLTIHPARLPEVNWGEEGYMNMLVKNLTQSREGAKTQRYFLRKNALCAFAS
jgi:hypothetical protein